MTTAAKVFLASAAFAAATGSLYWFVSYEWAGTVLLGSMVLAPGLVAAYLAARVRGAEVLPEDAKDAGPGDGAGPVGGFVAASLWPFLLAAATMLLAAGLVYGVWLLLPAGVAFAVAAVGIARE